MKGWMDGEGRLLPMDGRRVEMGCMVSWMSSRERFALYERREGSGTSFLPSKGWS